MNLSVIPLIIISLLLAIIGRLGLITYKPQNLSSKNSAEYEALYLPSGKALDLLSLGFKNTMADYLWLTTINYFGKHYSSDQIYRWLGHRCSLIHYLDPNAHYVTEFCSLILAYEANEASTARKILKQAINANPTYWRNYYLLGMNYLTFAKNKAAAKNYFIKGSQQPNVLPFLIRLAAKQLVELDEQDISLQFLEDSIKNATDANQQKALLNHYLKTLNEIKIKNLEKNIITWEQKNQRSLTQLSDLYELGISKSDLKDPSGKAYQLDLETRKIIKNQVFKNNLESN